MNLTNLDECIHVVDDGTSLEKVLQSITESGVQEDAFYVFDVGDIVRKYETFTTKLPRVKPFYAVKCNDNAIVLEVLATLGTNFDCASKGEINKVLDLGIDQSRILFANPAKPASHIRYAATVGVDLMTFDNESELHKVKSLYPNARLVIRVRCDADVAQCPLGLKFGCDILTEAPRLIRAARFLGLEVVGISFHVGSGCDDPPVFRRGIAAARKLFDYATTLGYNFDLLDLGGGYPGNTGTSIDKIADVINLALDEFFPDPSVKVIAEPGRFFVASAFALATNIHSKREVRNSDEKDGSITHVMYYINDGVYGAFNCCLYDHYYPLAIPLKNNGGKLTPSSVWGPTCDSMDQVVENINLPTMNIGDWFMFKDMGAYTMVAATTFNGFPSSKVHAIINEHYWQLLKDHFPLDEDRLVMGNMKFILGLDANGEGQDGVENWGIPVSQTSAMRRQEITMNKSSLPHLKQDNILEHCSPPPSAFLYEFVKLANALVVLSPTAEDGEIEVRISNEGGRTEHTLGDVNGGFKKSRRHFVAIAPSDFQTISSITRCVESSSSFYHQRAGLPQGTSETCLCGLACSATHPNLWRHRDESERLNNGHM
uniref:ornithine decarboxylase n=1 Tax=Timema californicum TaxID=61474 RepID=A0A7R9J7K0_TIMCA|nr:unnamed protein product [Timema californicum]